MVKISSLHLMVSHSVCLISWRCWLYVIKCGWCQSEDLLAPSKLLILPLCPVSSVLLALSASSNEWSSHLEIWSWLCPPPGGQEFQFSAPGTASSWAMLLPCSLQKRLRFTWILPTFSAIFLLSLAPLKFLPLSLKFKTIHKLTWFLGLRGWGGRWGGGRSFLWEMHPLDIPSAMVFPFMVLLFPGSFFKTFIYLFI